MAHPILSYIQIRSRAMGLDPAAVLAVARMEGLGGGIGDNGTSFGPWQLHYGGAYPSSAPHGASASQKWAWGKQGIDYALRQMAGVAKGLKGAAAVERIVTGFERPANPGREIAGALHVLGLPLPPVASPSPGSDALPGRAAKPQPTAPAPTPQEQQLARNRAMPNMAMQLLSQIGATGGLRPQAASPAPSSSPVLAMLARMQAPSIGVPAAPSPLASVRPARGAIRIR